METLFRSFRTQLEHTSTEVVRFLHDQIAWDSRLVAILGARGVGKTTLLLQHIKLYDREDESLYVTADDFYFTKYRLFDMAYQFYNLGGKKLYIDEIHKYKDWSREVKNIYDQIPGLQVIYTGSSILDLEKGGADLSRRKVEYRLPGLSFREYLNISQGWQLPSYSLEEILAGKVEFPYKEARPLKLFNDYLSTGYYPFFQDTEYLLRLRSVINQMVESDIPIFADMTVASAVKLKKLLYVLAPDKKIRSKTTTKGALFTTISWILATEIYTFYIGTFSSYDVFYGSISNIVILLLWIYILSYIFVVGMAINAGNTKEEDIERTGMLLTKK